MPIFAATNILEENISGLAMFPQVWSRGGSPGWRLKSQSHYTTIKPHQQTGEPWDLLCKPKGEALPSASALEII